MLRWQSYAAEFVGTFLLVLFAAGAVVATARLSGAPQPIVCGLASGVVLTAVIMLFTPISGAHVNPALTVGLAYLSRISWRAVPGYIAAQLAGSAAGGITIRGLLGSAASSGANVPNTAAGVTAAEAFGIEALLSAIMMLGILFCSGAGGDAQGGAVRIGTIVGVEVALFGPIAGAAMNPARAFGPYLVAGEWSTFWIYAVGPLVGILAVSAIYRKAVVRAAARTPNKNK